ncbi:RNA polymerase sigma factor FliA [Marinobacterium arenosum]|uniref:RNA polymerase sigma factor FliA n=1 Tax=Marinobacterium arenosum TaxID=2862496 RepID=UPI001C971F73|nr:RNA polymerase sigma factor FliA [Marinobacterium arenosum]MBY4675962.1 RNA polymerase sigma factor FliA [Marinobacterium arenosum]
MYNQVQFVSNDELIEQYAPLVKRIAHHLQARMPSSVVLDDLLQAGMIGLLEAYRNYDPCKGASFETYAGIRIRGAIIDEVRRGDWTPRSVHRNTRRISDAIHKIEARTGADAADAEVAAELGVTLDDYYALLKDSMESRLFSYDELVASSDEGPGDYIANDDPGPERHVSRESFLRSLAGAIERLPEREKLVLALYYDEQLNLKEIGQVLGVSESRVSQIHSQAAMRLRSRLRDWQ